MHFLVTGSPGVGKSLFAQKLKARLTALGAHVDVLSISELVKEEKLYEEYDDRLDTIVMDDRKVRKRLREILSDDARSFIVESHTVSIVPKKLIDQVFVLRVPNTTIYYDRLAARNYPPAKIEENIDCEIMQVVWMEAVERFESESVAVFVSETESQMEDALEEAMEVIKELKQ